MIPPVPALGTSPRVSVVIPCRNHGAHLPIAVASVQAQDHQSWECIIVDDGSTDDSADIAAALAARDTRIRVHRQPPRGLSAARNTGLRLARGEYVQFLDADDVITPAKFSIQLAALDGTTVSCPRGRTAGSISESSPGRSPTCRRSRDAIGEGSLHPGALLPVRPAALLRRSKVRRVASEPRKLGLLDADLPRRANGTIR